MTTNDSVGPVMQKARTAAPETGAAAAAQREARMSAAWVLRAGTKPVILVIGNGATRV